MEDRDGIDIANTLVGDQQAFAGLVARYQAVAFRVAYVITGDAGDAEEATQEAFLRVYRNLARFRSGSPFRPWLLEIVANAARTIRRRSRRTVTVPLAQVVLNEHPVSAPDETETTALRQADIAAVGRMLARLSEDDQRILILRYVLDLSEADIAASLGCRRGTVKSRLSRATARFRAQGTGADGAFSQ